MRGRGDETWRAEVLAHWRGPAAVLSARELGATLDQRLRGAHMTFEGQTLLINVLAEQERVDPSQLTAWRGELRQLVADWQQCVLTIPWARMTEQDAQLRAGLRDRLLVPLEGDAINRELTAAAALAPVCQIVVQLHQLADRLAHDTERELLRHVERLLAQLVVAWQESIARHARAALYQRRPWRDSGPDTNACLFPLLRCDTTGNREARMNALEQLQQLHAQGKSIDSPEVQRLLAVLEAEQPELAPFLKMIFPRQRAAQPLLGFKLPSYLNWVTLGGAVATFGALPFTKEILTALDALGLKDLQVGTWGLFVVVAGLGAVAGAIVSLVVRRALVLPMFQHVKGSLTLTRWGFVSEAAVGAAGAVLTTWLTAVNANPNGEHLLTSSVCLGAVVAGAIAARMRTSTLDRNLLQESLAMAVGTESNVERAEQVREAATTAEKVRLATGRPVIGGGPATAQPVPGEFAEQERSLLALFDLQRVETAAGLPDNGPLTRDSQWLTLRMLRGLEEAGSLTQTICDAYPLDRAASQTEADFIAQTTLPASKALSAIHVLALDARAKLVAMPPQWKWPRE